MLKSETKQKQSKKKKPLRKKQKGKAKQQRNQTVFSPEKMIRLIRFSRRTKNTTAHDNVRITT